MQVPYKDTIIGDYNDYRVLAKYKYASGGEVNSNCDCYECISYSETMLKRPKRINAFYLPGQGNCGHVISGSTVRLFRTFDFYKETDNTTYTEVGFKETPAATTLFSKIRFDPTMSLHAGQFMRVSYELRVNLNPATASAGGFTPSPFPAFTGWTTGSLDKEAIQKIGLCGIFFNRIE